jgi:uncharacterized membrane protein
VAGIVLIALAMRLKAKYKPFSAVLLSGGMAVLYFMTFAAYDFYQLIPQMLTFVLMVMFTGFTVFAALQYDMKVIAVIGLVGAYGVPFLLSDGSGRVHVLFSYMTIINIGILMLSFKKDWKVLYYIAFGLTWLIFLVWFASKYEATEHLALSLIFSTIFFATFYATFIAYKLIKQEALNVVDVILLMANAFLYYGFGYAAISDAANGELYLGIFTVFNALLHFFACYLIYKKQEASRDIFYLLAGMVLVFLTLAVPVQFDGHWVTLIWAFEAVLLFWIGRTKQFPVYEQISYALVVLTTLGLLYDWQFYYGVTYATTYPAIPDTAGEDHKSPAFFNMQVLSSLLVIISWIAILFIKHKNILPDEKKKRIVSIFDWAIPILIIVVLYATFAAEINAFWNDRYYATAVTTDSEYGYSAYNEDLLHFNTISLLIYSSLFLIGLWILNVKQLKNTPLYQCIVILSSFVVVLFITGGLYHLHELRSSFLYPNPEDHFLHGAGNILIRYLALITILPLLWTTYWTAKQLNMSEVLKNVLKVFAMLAVLVILSSELVNILDLAGIEGSDRLALSILWGIYALTLIVYGLKNDLKLFRIVAIVIFGITLLKLFLYDMSEMSTIAKTLVMVILGALLLIASFIYNKFKTPKNEA